MKHTTQDTTVSHLTASSTTQNYDYACLDFSQLLPREGWFSPHSNQQAAKHMVYLTIHDRPSDDARA